MARQGFFSKTRTYTAIVSTWLLNLGMFGVKFRKICSPGFNCHGCPWATGACPIGVFAFSTAMKTALVYAIGQIILIGALFGRHVCGYVCPFGLLQDIFHKIPTKKFRLPRIIRAVKYAALALLVFIFPFLMGFKISGFVQISNFTIEKEGDNTLGAIITLKNDGTEPVISPSLDIIYWDKKSKEITEKISKTFPGLKVEPGASLKLPKFSIPDKLKEANITIESPQSIIEQTPRYEFLYYCKLCPAGTLTATLPSYFVPKTKGNTSIYKGHILRFSILTFFLVLMVLVSRPFCQTFCPLGAFYGLTTRLSLISISLNKDACINCGQCDKTCPVNLDVRKEVGGPECIACGDCIKVCPKMAIQRKIGY